MYWDKRHNIINGLPYPGEEVLLGIQNLYEDVNNPVNENNYPNGMSVRILLGVQSNDISIDASLDQRFSVLDELKHLNIPVYKPLTNGRVWKVEVGLYKYGANETDIYSHLKLMVVDNNKMIVSGYMPTYSFRTIGEEAPYHDLGIKVSGPIAANGMAVFDSLWNGSEILCTEKDDIMGFIFILNNWGDCHTKPSENPNHWPFIPMGSDIVLPLYRDHDVKWADNAVQSAIESATEQVYVIQNRFGVPGDKHPALYKEDGWLSYADAVFNEILENTDIRILVSNDGFNKKFYNIPSMKNFVTRYEQNCGTPEFPDCFQTEEDFIRFYHPAGYPDSPPGLHTKAFMVDNKFLVIGSQNFDHSAFGNNDDDKDLVEYSVGIENETIIGSFITDSEINSIWDNSGKLSILSPSESLTAGIQQASAKDVIVLEAGIYEISSTLNIPGCYHNPCPKFL
jgi:phosphatidylserine/phosphatidylglycerophosphate/cardiolipin synthase-like enzyme